MRTCTRIAVVGLTLAVLTSADAASAQTQAAPVSRLVEIRSYKVKSGTAALFHGTAARTVVPMLREWGMDVVAFGPSAHESDAYFLIRAYDDLADLSAQQEAFYGSSLWRDGPRESIVSRIESYLSTVLWLSPESIEDLRRSNVYAAEGVDNDEA